MTKPDRSGLWLEVWAEQPWVAAVGPQEAWDTGCVVTRVRVNCPVGICRGLLHSKNAVLCMAIGEYKVHTLVVDPDRTIDTECATGTAVGGSGTGCVVHTWLCAISTGQEWVLKVATQCCTLATAFPDQWEVSWSIDASLWVSLKKSVDCVGSLLWASKHVGVGEACEANTELRSGWACENTVVLHVWLNGVCPHKIGTLNCRVCLQGGPCWGNHVPEVCEPLSIDIGCGQRHQLIVVLGIHECCKSELLLV